MVAVGTLISLVLTVADFVHRLATLWHEALSVVIVTIIVLALDVVIGRGWFLLARGVGVKADTKKGRIQRIKQLATMDFKDVNDVRDFGLVVKGFYVSAIPAIIVAVVLYVSPIFILPRAAWIGVWLLFLPDTLFTISRVGMQYAFIKRCRVQA